MKNFHFQSCHPFRIGPFLHHNIVQHTLIFLDLSSQNVIVRIFQSFLIFRRQLRCSQNAEYNNQENKEFFEQRFEYAAIVCLLTEIKINLFDGFRKMQRKSSYSTKQLTTVSFVFGEWRWTWVPKEFYGVSITITFNPCLFTLPLFCKASTEKNLPMWHSHTKKNIAPRKATNEARK